MSRFLIAAALVFVARSASAQQTCPATQPGATMPVTYKGGPTIAARLSPANALQSG